MQFFCFPYQFISWCYGPGEGTFTNSSSTKPSDPVFTVNHNVDYLLQIFISYLRLQIFQYVYWWWLIFVSFVHILVSSTSFLTNLFVPLYIVEIKEKVFPLWKCLINSGLSAKRRVINRNKMHYKINILGNSKDVISFI